MDGAFVEKFGETSAFDISNHLKRADFKYPVVIQAGEQMEGDLLIKDTITRVSGGNATHRRLFGLFGFGTTDVRTMGEIVDLRTSQSLVGFSFSKQSQWGGLPNEAAVRENLSQLALEIANILIQRRK